MSNPVFFFSYARADRMGGGTSRLNARDRGQGNSMDAFYQHLCDQIAALTALPADKVGFFDQKNLDLGTPWPKNLMDGLRSTSVMIALFSPTYFSRPACGREFEVFRRRHEALEKAGHSSSYRVLPVLWVRPDVTYQSIPGCCRDYVSRIQHTAPDMPETYGQYGLMRMYELGMTTDTNIICHKIADRVLALLKERPLPPSEEIDLDTLQSAFHEPAAAGAARPVDPAKREMRVYYLVPTRAEWAAESKGHNEFADLREKARPFVDAPGASVASATEEAIAEGGPDLGVTHEPLPGDLPGALAGTDGTMTTPIVVFDRRALTVPGLQSIAASYATRNFKNTGFVTVAGEEVPDAEVTQLFGAKIGALPKLHNWQVPGGRGAYVRNLASIVAELEAQIVRREIEALPPSGEAIPGLSGTSNG